MQQLIQSRVSLQEELSSLSAELIEAFINADTEYLKDESIYDVLRSYIKHVTRCGLCAGRSGLYELQDSFVQFQGILRSLLKHSPEVIDQYRIVLEQWPLLVMSYINSSRKPELMQQIDNLLTDTGWPSHDIAEPFSINCSQDDQSQLDANNGLLEEFHSCLEDMDKLSQEDRSADSQNIKMTLEQAATKLELFGVSAAAAGFVGLMDVAQILQSGLLTHSSIPRAFTEHEWDELITLKKVIEEYIKDPLEPEIIENVLCAIQECQLCERLPDSEIETLRNLFTLNDSDELETDSSQLTQESQEQNENNKQSQTGEESINTSIKLNSNEESADAIPEEVSDLLGLVAAEFENVIPGFSESLHSLLDTTREDKIRQEAHKQYIALLERFASVADSIGLNGLSIILVRLNTFFNQQSLDTAITPEQQLWLADWPAYVLNYLNNPYTNADELIQHCKLNNTILNINEEEYKQLSMALRAPNITIEEDEKEPRQTKAELNDVSLQLPEDVNQQLLDSLLQELPTHTEDFSNAIARIINGEGKLHDVEVAQRIAHTLKGSANTVGIIGIATLTHHIEDILTAFTKEQQLPQEPLTTTLQDAADILEMMSESLLGIGNVSEKQSLYVLQQVLDCANEIEQNGLPNTEHSTLNKNDVEVVEETLQHIEAKEQTTLRISTLTIDEILRLIGESIITNGQLHESLHNVLLQNQMIQEQNQLFQQLAFELEQLVDIRGINKYLSRADDGRFDSLEMDQYNELHTLSRRLVEATTDAREMSQEVDADLKHIENLLHSQSRIEKDTQELTMKTRMLPVKNIVPRLQRSVRQACRQTGKNVELEVVGSDTLIDNEILNMMADPLMHLLRNAVDHGIEASDNRNKVGKDAIGRIDLSFEREGEYIRIRCVDDGAGLDPNAIKNVAVKKGIINKDSNLSNDELYRLIILAGFTTRDQATQLSGRGIGMDAVYNQILRLKGTLKIENTMDGGACFEIQLPITLITIHGIMVKIRGKDLALSNRGVAQILHNKAGRIITEEKQIFYEYDEEKYIAYHIEDLLGLMRKSPDISDNDYSAIIVNAENAKQYVILVNNIIATRDVVIKKLGPFIPSIAGVEGATILGGGSIAPVIDLPALLHSFEGTSYVPVFERNEITGIQSGTPKVLVVDDSLSARRSLAEFMQDIGYRVITARDGMDAVDQLEQESPDVLLVDMEMPRMNGLELAAFVRAKPATHNIPIIMITSRATEKHRSEADKAGVNAYLVKPYSENEVMDVVEAQLKKAFNVVEMVNS